MWITKLQEISTFHVYFLECDMALECLAAAHKYKFKLLYCYQQTNAKQTIGITPAGVKITTATK